MESINESEEENKPNEYYFIINIKIKWKMFKREETTF